MNHIRGSTKGPRFHSTYSILFASFICLLVFLLDSTSHDAAIAAFCAADRQREGSSTAASSCPINTGARVHRYTLIHSLSGFPQIMQLEGCFLLNFK